MHGTRARLVRDCGIGRILAICTIEVLIGMRLLEGRVGFVLGRRCVSKGWGLRAPTTPLDGTCDGLDFLLAGLWVIWVRLASLHSYRGDLNSERVTLPCSRDISPATQEPVPVPTLWSAKSISGRNVFVGSVTRARPTWRISSSLVHLRHGMPPGGWDEKEDSLKKKKKRKENWRSIQACEAPQVEGRWSVKPPRSTKISCRRKSRI